MTNEELGMVIQDKISTIDTIAAQEIKRHQDFIATLQARKARLNIIKQKLQSVDLSLLDVLREEGILDKLVR